MSRYMSSVIILTWNILTNFFCWVTFLNYFDVLFIIIRSHDFKKFNRSFCDYAKQCPAQQKYVRRWSCKKFFIFQFFPNDNEMKCIFRFIRRVVIVKNFWNAQYTTLKRDWNLETIVVRHQFGWTSWKKPSTRYPSEFFDKLYNKLDDCVRKSVCNKIVLLPFG